MHMHNQQKVKDTYTYRARTHALKKKKLIGNKKIGNKKIGN